MVVMRRAMCQVCGLSAAVYRVQPPPTTEGPSPIHRWLCGWCAEAEGHVERSARQLAAHPCQVASIAPIRPHGSVTAPASSAMPRSA